MIPDSIPLEKVRRSWPVRVCIDMHYSALRWSRDEASGLAAGVAYYLALSLFPLMLLLSAGLGLFLRFTDLGADAQEAVLQFIAQHTSPVVKEQIAEVLAQLKNQSLISCPAGIVTAILAAVGVFNQFDRSLDRIWRVKLPEGGNWRVTVRRVLRDRILAFMMLISVGAMLALVFVCNLALAGLHTWAAEYFPWSERLFAVAEIVLTISLNAFLFANLYRGLAKQRVVWRDALRGGLLVALLWEGGRQLLGMFLIGMRYTAAYGVIGSFIALLLWCYYGVSMILFGAEYIQVLQERRKQADPPAESNTQRTHSEPNDQEQILLPFPKREPLTVRPRLRPRRRAA